MSLIAVILTASTANAACPADAAVLRADLQAAEQAYKDWAWADFDQDLAEVRADLGCLNEVLSGPDSQAVHALFVLVGARTQNAELAQAAFGGLLAADLDYAPELVLAPKGSLLRDAYERALAAEPAAGEPLPEGAWFVDGKPGVTELPSQRTSVVQLLSGGGVFESWYVEGAGLPAGLADRLVAEPAPVSAAPPPPTPVEPTAEPGDTDLVEAAERQDLAPAPRDKGAHRSRGLLLGGVALAAVGAGGMVYGEVLEGQMDDVDARRTAKSMYQVGLATTFGGYALGAAGGALVVGAVVKGRW